MRTEKIPKIPLRSFKRTKIIATVGPATNSYEAILSLVKGGANGIRLNFSHGTYDERSQQIKWIRRASKEENKPVAIIQDLQGPKVRVGDFEGEISIKKGQEITLKHQADYERSGYIPLQYNLADKVKVGERFFIFDGKLKSKIIKVEDGLITVKAQNGAVLSKRKGINVPDTDFDSDIITAKDKKDLAFGSVNDIDFVALSFVQKAQDVRQLRKLLQNLGSQARVIAKIETKAAADNLEQIIDAADVVMVARGDLAVEANSEEVPIIQRRIIEVGKLQAKPTIVATQMLASMTENIEPTRAEVSDVATAVLLGTDAVMLSDETASGKHPIDAVKTMKKIVSHTQAHAPQEKVSEESQKQLNRTQAIASSIISLARAIAAKAIVAETKSGATALLVAAKRPTLPIIAVTDRPRVAQQLAIVYGIKSYVRPDHRLQATKLTNWLLRNKVLSSGDIVVTASGKHPGVVGATDTIKVRIL